MGNLTGPRGEVQGTIESASAMSNSGADRSIGGEEEDCIKSRLESIKDTLEGMQEEPEFDATHKERSES